MGKGVDFNRIFFGRHERGHRSATAAILVFAVILAAYAYTNQNALSTQATTTLQQPQPVDMCSNFPDMQGEISCGGAIVAALKEFPGEVTGITKAQISVRQRDSKDLVQKDAWSVEITLAEPFRFPDGKEAGKLAVQIDRQSGDILALKMI